MHLEYSNMLSNNPSKKSNKIAEKSTVPVTEQTVADSKPAKRTTKPSTAAVATSTPKKTSHHHSKLAAPMAEAPTTPAPVIPVPVTPKYEDVARLAYSFWEERNCADGFAEEDWFRAVKTLAAAR
jgi:hypothetical protein